MMFMVNVITDNDKFIRYYESDGLETNEYNGFSYHKNKDGSSDYLIKLDEAMIKYLLDNLQTKFSSNVFNKGLDYFRKNKVGDITFSENKISATVHGTEDYFTEVTFEDGKLRYNCSCPVEGVCKHVVALLIASQQKLKALRQNKSLPQSTIVVEKQDIKLNTLLLICMTVIYLLLIDGSLMLLSLSILFIICLISPKPYKLLEEFSMMILDTFMTNLGWELIGDF